ncbi:hypothetical protein [Paractinoplanes globisporus]|uniref:Alpha/beta hydrolase n=1 Tax=Paractinoplanes globisporus TaxID=113565 RepID=A0ABW6W960_9ACTN|nr:hypothetical protein [Actinoplanes globisporus]
MNIVLVHGAWADGSCWSGVIERLQATGHKVTAGHLAMISHPGETADLIEQAVRSAG